MPNFNPADQTSIAGFIIDNLSSHKQFALGTTDDQGSPWVVALNLSFDSDLNIMWLSDRRTEHSKHIASRPEVAICIFSENEERGDFGFYAEAKARQVTNPKELKHLLAIRFISKGKHLPSVRTFLGAANIRLYYAELTKAWINDDQHIKTPVDLSVLRTVARQHTNAYAS